MRAFLKYQPKDRLAAAVLVCLIGAGLGACGRETDAAEEQPRPVRVITVEEGDDGETVSLTGTIQAETEVDLAFRIDGRMIERPVGVGDVIKPGQIVARLDSENEQNALRSAAADLAAARGKLVKVENDYERQKTLLGQGWATRARYDQAAQALKAAQSAKDSAEARKKTSENRVSYTELQADGAGTVTATGATAGEVVQAGRMILQVARESGIDAVFGVPAQIKDNAPANPEIEVFLTMDPGVKAVGRVREVAPRADAVTWTFQVKVALTDPPAAMRLGSTVTGRMHIGLGPSLQVPASALTRIDDNPAVWIVDPQTKAVSLRPVKVQRFTPALAAIESGLQSGEIVVTAGVQALRPGQKVRLLGATQ